MLAQAAVAAKARSGQRRAIVCVVCVRGRGVGEDGSRSHPLSLSVVRPWIDISSILQARSRRDAATPLPASGFRRLLLFSLCLKIVVGRLKLLV